MEEIQKFLESWRNLTIDRLEKITEIWINSDYKYKDVVLPSLIGLKLDLYEREY